MDGLLLEHPESAPVAPNSVWILGNRLQGRETVAGLHGMNAKPAMGRQQGVLSHQAQYASAGDPAVVQDVPPCPSLALALAGEGRGFQISADGDQKIGVGDLRLRAAPLRTHQPLYRQSGIYARSGVEPERSTLADWVGQRSALLRPRGDARYPGGRI